MKSKIIRQVNFKAEFRIPNTCTIQIVEHMERWRERLVGNIIEPLAVK